jgi:hypothetical protein
VWRGRLRVRLPVKVRLLTQAHGAVAIISGRMPACGAGAASDTAH